MTNNRTTKTTPEANALTVVLFEDNNQVMWVRAYSEEEANKISENWKNGTFQLLNE